MLEDVLAALAAAPGLAGRLLVTTDPGARSALAGRYGAAMHRADGADDGHTGAVTAAARRLAAEGRGGMLTLPGDIPLVTAGEIERLIAAHRSAPSFTIAPSHDEQGSNAIILSPPDAVPLRFGDDSFFPHLAAAEACGIAPDGVAPARDRLGYRQSGRSRAFCATRIAHASGPVARGQPIRPGSPGRAGEETSGVT